MSIPKQYKKSSWRGTLPVDTGTNEIGICFNLFDGQTIRLRLDCEGAQHLSESIRDYLHEASLSLSDNVSGMSSVIVVEADKEAAIELDRTALNGLIKE